MKIKIYAEGFYEATQLAASMNLALRHWEYAGSDGLGSWADVDAVMERLEDLEFRMEGLEK